MNNIANLYAPIISNAVGPTPLVLRAIVNNNNSGLVGGVPTSNQKLEEYVLLSALPEDLRRRVILTVQTLLAGM